jgi:carbamoyltransferase
VTAILGLNAFHGDAAAALLIDGELVAAVEEERFTRVKHAAGFPARSARWCLAEAGLDAGDLDHVAVSRDPRANVGHELLRSIRDGASARYLKATMDNAAKPRDAIAALAQSLEVPPESIRASLHDVEHHQAHVASAFFVCPFEHAAILSADGFGDFCSTMTAVGRSSSFEVLERVLFPHSLGMLYAAFTQWLGFSHYGDEGKTMGLASYGDPLPNLKAMRDVVDLHGDLFSLNLDYFTHDREGVDMIWDEGAPRIDRIYSDRVIETFGPAREPGDQLTQHHKDVAASLQRVLEEAYVALARRLRERTALGDLCLAGGVALNAVANDRVRAESGFGRIYVPPAAGDSGTAVGAAYYVWHQLLGQPRSFVMRHAFTGPDFREDETLAALAAAGVRSERLADDALFAAVAERLAAGDVVGWFQGRMEFGPRALGHRSIVADPRRPEMKQILNSRIKHRESFLPFAPSVLAEATGDWFERDDPSPFMALVSKTRRDKRERIPAVNHVDDTGRLQTVESAVAPRYHRLIEAFHRLTGVPILLNTSFNENEPIVMTPAEAVETFLKTRMDLLVLGNYVVRRDGANTSGSASARATTP